MIRRAMEFLCLLYLIQISDTLRPAILDIKFMVCYITDVLELI